MSRKSQKGFSIIELVFAIFLIVVTLVIYASSLSLVPLTKTTKYQNVAYHLALKRIEILRNTDYASLPASGSISDSDFLLLPQGTGALAISDIGVGLKQATVTISWAESNGTKSVSLDTYIYQSGLNNL